MIDSFASDPADADHAIHLQIDEDLRNARRLHAEFEDRFPDDPEANVRRLVQRVTERPTPNALYPRLTATKEHRRWLLPLVRRYGWNHACRDAGAVWTDTLAEMIRLTLVQVPQVSEPEFLELAEAAEWLKIREYPGSMALFARGLENTGPLGTAAVDALRRLLRLFEPPHSNSHQREPLLWPLFRSETGFDAQDSGWRARVRREIAAMAPPLRSHWLKAFNPATRTCQAAIRKLGSAQLESGLRRWIGLLREMPEPILSADDAIVFRHVVALCDLLGGGACDQLLYEVACIRWTQKPEHCWMYQYLHILRNRPQNHAFACLEALMMNPVTAGADVRRQYEAQLAVFGSEATEESPVGVDGFPLNSDPRLTAQHRRIDQLLRMAATAAAGGRYVDPAVQAHLAAMQTMNKEALPPAQRAALEVWQSQLTRPLPWFPVSPEVTAARKAMEKAILQEFAADPAGLNRAMTTRAEWIRTHQHEFSKDTLQLWNEWLHGLGCSDGLVGRSLAKVDELALESLLAAIKAGGNGTKVFELCRKYVAKHGWHAGLVEPFRQFIPRLGVACNQTENARAEWFLWFENVAPIKVDECWSYRIRQDLRAMPADESSAWRALLDNPTFIITGVPPAKWIKAAEKLFPAVGIERFRPRFIQWFEPFAKGEPLRLTITGRNILRVLIWYVLIAKDETVDQALLGFAHARWKTKEFAKRVAQAEMAFSYVLGQREPKGALPILEALVESGQAFEGSTTHRVYLQLCERRRRAPVKASPQQTRPAKEPAPNSILDNLTIGEFRNLIQGKGSKSSRTG